MASDLIPKSGDVWASLDDEQRAKIDLGNEAFRRLKRGETIERWREVGEALVELQQAALRQAKTNNKASKAYRDAWALLIDQHAPDLRDVDPGARSHAVWMVTNWHVVKPWLDTLAANVRLDLNHPRSVHRKYDATHKPPPPDEGPDTPSARVKLQEQIVKLQEENDALRGRAGKGSIIVRSNASAKETIEMFADERNVDFLKRMRAALDEVIQRETRQDAIEATQRRKR